MILMFLLQQFYLFGRMYTASSVVKLPKSTLLSIEFLSCTQLKNKERFE